MGYGFILLVFLVVLFAGWNERSLFQSLFCMVLAGAFMVGTVAGEPGSPLWISCVGGLALLTMILFLAWKGGDQRLPLQ